MIDNRDVITQNLFQYCGNNPVNSYDPNGHLFGTIIAVGALVVGIALLAGCRSNRSATPSKPSTTSSRRSPRSSSGTTSTKESTTSSSITAGGKTVHRGSIRICTDGSDGTKVSDRYWQRDTAYFHNGKPIDAYTVPYVVIPIGDTSAKLGDSALLINHDTGMSVMCVVGERGPSANGWGEVSICAIWDTGNPDHMTANHTEGLSSNYEIILYPGVRYEWRD